MSAYKDAIIVDDYSSEQHLRFAISILEQGQGILIYNNVLALRHTSNTISCEVIDPNPNSHRCEEEFKVLVENAGRDLANSKLGRLLANKTLRWLVVEDYATETLEVWPGPIQVN